MGDNEPSSFPAGTPKTHFSYSKCEAYVICSEVVKCEAEIVHQWYDVFSLDDHIVHICFNCVADLFFQVCLNHALVSGTSVFKPKRHSVETERPIQGNKRRCGRSDSFILI